MKARVENTTDMDAADLVTEAVVYQCPSFFARNQPPVPAPNPSNTSVNGDDVSEISRATTPQVEESPSLVFDADFETANLDKALRISGRDKIQPLVNISPSVVHQEYDLYIRKDLHTRGHIQWYYFKVSTGGTDRSYPLVVRFNIVNMLKSDALYNYGMRPAVYSTAHADQGWHHDGYDICYYKNTRSYTKKSKKNKMKLHYHYTLSFTYTFMSDDDIYFAHTFPYTYTQLQRYMAQLICSPGVSSFMRHKVLASTLANNRCDLLTVTAPCLNPVEFAARPAIIVSARVHPGESNSSYVMQGFLDFISSDDEVAVALRKSFVFKIIPMLNPDGVIHGNYRCSLAGVDLNRQYKHPDPILHPTIFALKNLIKSTNENRGVLLYLDIHGHSMKKNVFLYGCDPYEQQHSKASAKANALGDDKFAMLQRKLFSRLFPRILCEPPSAGSVSNFQFRDCSYTIQKSKAGTGRVVCWRSMGILAAYTIEISFCGNGDNLESKIIKKSLQSATKAAQATKDVERSDLLDVLSGNGKHAKILQALVDRSKKYTHYTQRNLLDIGKEIALAIYDFTNLKRNSGKSLKCVQFPKPADVLSRKQRVKTLENALHIPTPLEINVLENEEDLEHPIVIPAVASEAVLVAALNNGNFECNRRFLIENELREMLLDLDVFKDYADMAAAQREAIVQTYQKKLDKTASIVTNGVSEVENKTLSKDDAVDVALHAVQNDDIEDILEIYSSFNSSSSFDMDVDGSDSDPSGDELPINEILSSKSFQHLSAVSKLPLVEKIQKSCSIIRKRRKKNKSARGRKQEADSARATPPVPPKAVVEEKTTPSPPPIKPPKRRGFSIAASHRQAIIEAMRMKKQEKVSLFSAKNTVRVRTLSIDPSVATHRTAQSFASFHDYSTKREVTFPGAIGDMKKSASDDHIVKNASIDSNCQKSYFGVSSALFSKDYCGSDQVQQRPLYSKERARADDVISPRRISSDRTMNVQQHISTHSLFSELRK